MPGQISQPPNNNKPPSLIKNTQLIPVILIIIALSLGIYLFQIKNTPEHQTITVTGKSSMEIKADKAVIRVIEESTGETTEEAKNKNAAGIEELKKYLVNKGIKVNESKFIIEDQYANKYSFGGGGGGGGGGGYYNTPGAYALAENKTQKDILPMPTIATVPQPAVINKPINYSNTIIFRIVLLNEEVDKNEEIADYIRKNATSVTTSYALNDMSKFDYELKGKAMTDAGLQVQNLAKAGSFRITKIISISVPDNDDFITLTYRSSINNKDEFYTKKVTVNAIYNITYEISPL